MYVLCHDVVITDYATDFLCRMKEEFESSPDRWFRRSHFDHYIENVEAAAKFVGAKPENTVLVRNATTG